jgi:hypothetical protein
MPRPGPRRPTVLVRMSQAAIDAIDKLAAEREITRSEMVRLMLAYAQRTMPKGWRP